MSFFEDLQVYREGVFAQGFWALQIYRFGHARYQYRSRVLRLFWGGVHFILSKFSEIFFGISIGVTAKIGERLVIEHFGNIVIHGSSIIGNDCIIRQGVTLGNKNIESPYDAPILGNSVNIGAGAKILGRVTIGDNVCIGANAVVISDVPSMSIAVGVPATIKKRVIS